MKVLACVVLVAALVAPSLACSDKVDSFVAGLYYTELGKLGLNQCTGNYNECMDRLNSCMPPVNLLALNDFSGLVANAVQCSKDFGMTTSYQQSDSETDISTQLLQMFYDLELLAANKDVSKAFICLHTGLVDIRMTFQTVLVYLVAAPVVITDEVGDGGDARGGGGGGEGWNNNNTTEQLNWINLLKTAGVDVTLATTTTTTTTLGTPLDDDVAGGLGCGNLVSCQPPLEDVEHGVSCGHLSDTLPGHFLLLPHLLQNWLYTALMLFTFPSPSHLSRSFPSTLK
ncbi:hypothetical protein Pcinc_010417 [Petrolisthes cinctipes]|uniref:Secreted protein n=1 Tax=Petrolisthes cinctipes TaxID=88211 RepID=A0AAE1KTM2_PETCI|nr:hypothetical protein Pcinc_010417 [Petrolisthes cinctipes]